MNLESVHNSSNTPTFSVKEMTAKLPSLTHRATLIRPISVLEAFIKKSHNISPKSITNLAFTLLWYRYIYGFQISNLISTEGQKIC
jgi:hypothetical protein